MECQRKAELESLCGQFRIDVIEMIYEAQTGHPGGSLSVCEILTALYFEKANISKENHKTHGRDRIVVSKGHSAPMLYRILAEKGFFPKAELKGFRQIGSHLQGHPSPVKTPGVELPSGPLGMAYPAALGLALALKMDDVPAYVYAVLGDGETNEGVIWEAAMSASKFKATNLITIVDKNGVQLDGVTREIMPMLDLGEKFKAFGYNVITCDGHDIGALCDAIDKARESKQKPPVIIADTIKGKGVSFMEGRNVWHSKPLTKEEFDLAVSELKGGRV